MRRSVPLRRVAAEVVWGAKRRSRWPGVPSATADPVRAALLAGRTREDMLRNRNPNTASCVESMASRLWKRAVPTMTNAPGPETWKSDLSRGLFRDAQRDGARKPEFAKRTRTCHGTSIRPSRKNQAYFGTYRQSRVTKNRHWRDWRRTVHARAACNALVTADCGRRAHPTNRNRRSPTRRGEPRSMLKRARRRSAMHASALSNTDLSVKVMTPSTISLR